MALINPDGYYFFDIKTWRTMEDYDVISEWREGAPKIYYTRNWDDGRDYYYLEFKEAEAFGRAKLREHIQPEVIRALRNPDNNVHLVVNNSHEAFLSVVEPVYRYIVMGLGIPAHKVILMSGAFDIEEEIERVRPTYNQPPLKAELTLDFEDSTLTTLQVMMHDKVWQAPHTLDPNRTYHKKFLNFNRRWRLHRPTFVAMLKHRGLLDQGYVSLAPSDDNIAWDQAWKSVITMNHDFPWIVSAAYEIQEELQAMGPLYLDTHDLVTNRAMLEPGSRVNYLYEETYFSLISETNFYTVHSGYEKSKFLSEKAFKPIVYRHPFILISTPGVLSCMKQIGYQSFDGLIDESYDQISNDGDRMDAILKETQRLCDLKGDDLKKFLGGCKEVCDYNFRTLYNKKQFQHKLNYT